ncbi:hypothetical protein EV193_110119 [Herbihabitans rhizosphaerae]|uniref:Carbohydrate binding protein n=1 Tax=Herbihabitans rhizosphaerae TaxID=1872711 RepID=A0A4Q7KFX8_9PSEU|nr:hypothetical protein [Herbihabitans rhizosphaerae]RZS33969.1 hypothetical protein EV193_110119 [Herbihabitans rhizosphaerae]
MTSKTFAGVLAAVAVVGSVAFAAPASAATSNDVGPAGSTSGGWYKDSDTCVNQGIWQVNNGWYDNFSCLYEPGGAPAPNVPWHLWLITN